uniref:Putative peptidase n=2 Tax=viral metagenome TaxID=1070528 RepID=A0A6M3J6F6_9ZZZZ
MKWYRPVKTLMITQRWGTNGEWYQANGINIKGHNGYDFKCFRGEPVYHSVDFEGKVKTEIDNRGGIGVRVNSIEPDPDLGYIQALYWHLEKVHPDIYDGKIINVGTCIGYGDSTGFSTGDHVHFGLKQITKTGRTLNSNNGYTGAIDPTTWFDNTFIIDVFDDLQAQILTLAQLIQKFIATFKGRK